MLRQGESLEFWENQPTDFGYRMLVCGYDQLLRYVLAFGAERSVLGEPNFTRAFRVTESLQSLSAG
jgi:hypothetical protein